MLWRANGSRRQLTWQAVCTRAARSRTRAGSEVCEDVSMPVGAVSATAGCRSRSSRAGRPVREVARSAARLCAVWPLYCVQVVIRLPPPASGGFVLLLVGGQKEKAGNSKKTAKVKFVLHATT